MPFWLKLLVPLHTNFRKLLRIARLCSPWPHQPQPLMLGPLLRISRRQGSFGRFEIDGATILAPLTADPNDEEAEIVENAIRDDVFAK